MEREAERCRPVGEGETILKSIFFGQLGGAIGHAVEGVLAG